MAKRSAFEARYWNLAQAAAWVIYRERRLVDDLADADRDSYAAIGLYPSMWPAGREKKADLGELHQMLIDGDLKAFGRRADTPHKDEEIPAREWQLLRLVPPLVYDARRLSQRVEPWTEVRIEAAAMQKLWRGASDVDFRTKYDWDELRRIHDEQRELHPLASKNTLIDKIQMAYEIRYNKEPPGRSTIQSRIKRWRQAGRRPSQN